MSLYLDTLYLTSFADDETPLEQRIERRLNSHTMSYSVNAPPKAFDRDEIFMKKSLQFADSLKDLKNLKKQLYSAADCFESSYNKDNHKQFVVESSKDYVAKALVSTVDHLGSVADKLNKFFDEKATEFSKTKIQFSLIEQRLSTFQEFIHLKGLSRHLLKTEVTGHHKHNILPETFASGKSKVLYRKHVSSMQCQVQKPKHDNSFFKAFQAARMKLDSPLPRKEVSSREPSPNQPTFSFIRILPSKEAGMRSVSPLHFSFNLSGSVIKRIVSPNKLQQP